MADARHTTVRDLTPDDFGRTLVIDGWMLGDLYGIDDQFHDGYPDRTLTLVPNVDGDGMGRDRRFTDSDPEGYLKTMDTRVIVLPVDAEPGMPTATRPIPNDADGPSW